MGVRVSVCMGARVDQKLLPRGSARIGVFNLDPRARIYFSYTRLRTRATYLAVTRDRNLLTLPTHARLYVYGYARTLHTLLSYIRTHPQA